MLPHRTPRKKGRVEIIPMIDVMLFLLVFFIMITLQMITDKGPQVEFTDLQSGQDATAPSLSGEYSDGW
jgi:Biopolymer transport protein ExbD/TolR.